MIKTIYFNNIFLISSATVGGPKEKEGPLGEYLDYCYDDMMANQDSYEKGESEMISKAISLAIQKSRLNIKEIELIVGGDLSNQIASSHNALKNIPCSFIGVYGACSTSILSLIVACNFVNGGACSNALSFTSSNYGSAERQFRYPNEYGVRKKESATTTVTGSGAVIVSDKVSKIQVISATIGKVNNGQWLDINDMGSAMAYAAYDTLINHFINTKTTPESYDLILTGDLSRVGSKVLVDLFNSEGIDLVNYNDAGNLIYDPHHQSDIYSGGSGCACLALTGFSFILEEMIKKKLKNVLLVGTGCLHSKISASQKETIPVVAHLIHLRRV